MYGTSPISAMTMRCAIDQLQRAFDREKVNPR